MKIMMCCHLVEINFNLENLLLYTRPPFSPWRILVEMQSDNQEVTPSLHRQTSQARFSLGIHCAFSADSIPNGVSLILSINDLFVTQNSKTYRWKNPFIWTLNLDHSLILCLYLTLSVIWSVTILLPLGLCPLPWLNRLPLLISHSLCTIVSNSSLLDPVDLQGSSPLHDFPRRTAR